MREPKKRRKTEGRKKREVTKKGRVGKGTGPIALKNMDVGMH